MKFIASILAGLAAFAGVATAQINIPGLPDCASKCVSIPPQCQTLDFQCICSDRNFITSISCCIAKSCNADDQTRVINFAQSLCKNSGGVTDLPTKAVCPSSTSVVTTTATVANGACDLRFPAGGMAGAIAAAFAVF